MNLEAGPMLARIAKLKARVTELEAGIDLVTVCHTCEDHRPVIEAVRAWAQVALATRRAEYPAIPPALLNRGLDGWCSTGAGRSRHNPAGGPAGGALSQSVTERAKMRLGLLAENGVAGC